MQGALAGKLIMEVIHGAVVSVATGIKGSERTRSADIIVLGTCIRYGTKEILGASRSMPIGSLLHQGLDMTAITVATGNSIIVVGDQIVAKKIEAR